RHERGASRALLDADDGDDRADRDERERDPEGLVVVETEQIETRGGGERAERWQARAEGDVEPADRHGEALLRSGRRDPDEEGIGEEWVTETAQAVGDEDQDDAGSRERHRQEEDLEDDPDRRPDEHHSARAPQVRQRGREERGDGHGGAVDGDEGARERDREAVLRGEERREDVRLDAIADHEDREGDEAPDEGARKTEPIEGLRPGFGERALAGLGGHFAPLRMTVWRRA